MTTHLGRERSFGWMAVCARAGSLTLALTILFFVTGCQGLRWGFSKKHGDSPIKAVWVTRWDYKTPDDIARVMHNCKTAGFNTILFQVRGNGTVFYPSKIEPWAVELGGRDPGFDPLAVAIAQAHGRGLKIHAWANVIPGWRGEEPPNHPRQLYNAHPDWFWRDDHGQRQPLGWYVSVNPVYPEVREHIVSVMEEIVSRYDVDGLHLDYVRFPNEWNDSWPDGASVPDYPRDPRTLGMFKRMTGRVPSQAPDAWNAFRTEAVTQVVRDIRKMMLKKKPKAALSAALGASPDEAKRRHFQDSRRWVREGLLDAVYPMNYASSMNVYSKRLVQWNAIKGDAAVVTGIMFDKRSGGTVRQQLDYAMETGGHFSAFAYNSLFERFDENGQPLVDDQSPSRAELRKQIIPYLRRGAS